MEKGTVCVTGGTGFVASWLIKRLLEDGYFVNTKIRSHPGISVQRKTYVSYLTNLPQATEKLKFFYVDIKKPQTFEAPINGCIGVFHVAHPTESNDNEEVVVEKSVKVALGILQVCVDSKTVKKVVYTSSIAAIISNGTKHTEIVGEESWSDVDHINSHIEFGAWYYTSKTLTEKAILEFGEKHRLDVVTVHPSFIHGPFLGPQCPKSVRNLMAMIFGDTNLYAMLVRAPFVHIDDVASAHIHLFEHPKAKGRYICSKTEMPIEDLYELLSSKYPAYNIPNIDFLESLDVKKMMITGFKFKYGIEEMFDDAIDCCKCNAIL